MSFSSLGLPAELLRGVADLGLQHPTALQDLAVPPALEGRDLLVHSSSRRGKAAAFLLPVLSRILQGESGHTRGLILTPDGVAGAKVDELRARLASHTRTTGAAIFGGVDKTPQERALKAGADVVVATPGRLLEHMEESYGRLYDLEILVIDEAHRMAAEGLLPDVERILENLPADLQVLVFTEERSEALEGLLGTLREPVEIELMEESADTGAIEQGLYPVADDLKPALVAALVEAGTVAGALVLTRTRHRANRVASLLRKRDVPADRVHGNRSQAQRAQVMEQFRDGQLKVLVATDLPLEEVDADHLSHVIFLDLPASVDEYGQRLEEAAARGCHVFALAAPGEGRELSNLDSAHGPLPRVTVDGFDYEARAEEPLEIPPDERRGGGARKGRPARKKPTPPRQREREAEPQDAQGRRRRRRRKGQSSGAGGGAGAGQDGQWSNPRRKRGAVDNVGNVKRRRGKGGVPPEQRADYDPENYGNRVSDPDPYSGRMGELIPASLRDRREDPRDSGRPVDQQGRPTHKPSFGRFGRWD
jgi:ATP-dependent RNA helicase RhlE